MPPVTLASRRDYGSTGTRCPFHARATAATVARVPGASLSSGEVILSQAGTRLTGLNLTGLGVKIDAADCAIIGCLWRGNPVPFRAIELTANAARARIAWNRFEGPLEMNQFGSFVEAPLVVGASIDGIVIENNHLTRITNDFVKLNNFGAGCAIRDNWIGEWVQEPEGARNWSAGLTVAIGDILIDGEDVYRVTVAGVTTADAGQALSQPPAAGYARTMGKPHTNFLQGSPRVGGDVLVEGNAVDFRGAPGFKDVALDGVWRLGSGDCGLVRFRDNRWDTPLRLLWTLSLNSGLPNELGLPLVADFEDNAVPEDTQGTGITDGGSGANFRIRWVGNIGWQTGNPKTPPDGVVTI